mgnify:CR=1 FL=1
MFAARTLRYYVAKRFLLSIAAAFTVCAALIFMIDMIELLRLSRRAVDLSIANLFGWPCCACPRFPRSCCRLRCWWAASLLS